MDLKNYKNIYMIGIGGISMSGLAHILVKWNYKVSGSNNEESITTKELESNNIHVNIGHNANNISENIDLVVYTAAIKSDNVELVKAKELNIPCIERGEFLGELTKLFKDTIGIAGTHGKTSTTSMVSSCFLEGGKDPSIQVGATLDIINGNYRVGDSDYFIIEACEYCDSYLNFKQKSAIVLNIDDDHLDYFKNTENIEASFRKYVSNLPSDGFLVINNDDERASKLKNYTKAKIITTGIQNDAMYMAKDISFDKDGCGIFTVYKNNELIDTFTLAVPGVHMIRNALCCIALCSEYNIATSDIKAGLLKYHGASRRLEYKGMFNNAKVFDDYGHHPTEIEATAKAFISKEHNESWVIWEGHTYSRVFEHKDEFAESLKYFDHIIVIDIYAAREENTFGIEPEYIVDKLKVMNKDAVYISDYDEVVTYLKERVKDKDIILTLGAGYVTKISELLTK